MEQMAYPMDKLTFSTEKAQEPDWFRIGRDAIKVMERLSSMRELDFYLRHPEPFIRLYAIRRVAGLLLPDAVPALAKRLEDPLENEQNRDEAGWAIKRICHVKAIAWFAKTPWTDRYDGTETASERYGVSLADAAGSGTNPTSRSTQADEPVADEVLLRIQMEEANPTLSFSVMPWFLKNSRYLALAAVKALAGAMMFVVKGILHLITLTGRGLIGLLKKGVSARRRKKNRANPTTPSVTETQPREEPPAILDPVSSLRGRQHLPHATYRNHRYRKGGQSVFRLLFYPIRLVKNHWVFTLLVLLVFYALLGFSQPGRRFVLQLNPGAQRANDRLVAVVRTKAADYLGLSASKQPTGRADSIQDGNLLTGAADEAAAVDTATAMSVAGQTPVLLASVSAPKGLNLRETPASSGEKIVWMNPGAEVTLLGIAQTDTAGDLWQTVQYEDRVGWAMDKWLTPISREASDGGF